MSASIAKYLEALSALRTEGILTNNKDFTCQIGEWLVEQMYDGKRAVNAIQRSWDVQVGDKYIQVKTHAKRGGNHAARWSAIEKNPTEKLDEVIIIVFSSDYKLLEFYQVPWVVAQTKIKLRGKKSPREELNWNAIAEFSVPIEKLPKQEIVRLFL